MSKNVIIGVLLLIVDALRERSRDSRDDESEEPPSFDGLLPLRP